MFTLSFTFALSSLLAYELTLILSQIGVAEKADDTVHDLAVVDLHCFPEVEVAENVKVLESSHQSLQDVYNPEGVLLDPSNVLAVILTVSPDDVPPSVILGFH